MHHRQRDDHHSATDRAAAAAMRKHVQGIGEVHICYRNVIIGVGVGSFSLITRRRKKKASLSFTCETIKGDCLCNIRIEKS